MEFRPQLPLYPVPPFPGDGRFALSHRLRYRYRQFAAVGNTDHYFCNPPSLRRLPRLARDEKTRDTKLSFRVIALSILAISTRSMPMPFISILFTYKGRPNDRLFHTLYSASRGWFPSGLFHGNRLGQLAGVVDVAAAELGD